MRNFEAVKFLHIGMIAAIPRKSLPAIARTVSLEDGQELHHFLRDTRKGSFGVSSDAIVVNQSLYWGPTDQIMY